MRPRWFVQAGVETGEAARSTSATPASATPASATPASATPASATPASATPACWGISAGRCLC